MSEEKEFTITVLFFFTIIVLTFVVGIAFGYYWHYQVIAAGGG